MRIAFAVLLLCACLASARAVEPSVLASVVAPAQPPDPAYLRVVVAKVSTSIYIGKVTLTMPPFERHGATYTSTYAAKVFPFFFQNERGSLSITLSEADLVQLAANQRVHFTGDAANTDGEPRKIEGYADPADPLSGRIKIRVFVTEKIQLIFNTTYRFTGAPR